MERYVYSDESGVFDKFHNEVFVFGGLIFLKKREMENCSRKYIVAENAIRGDKYGANDELKACRISNKEKGEIIPLPQSDNKVWRCYQSEQCIG